MTEEKTNLWRKFEAVVKPVTIVLAFVGLLLVGFCNEAKADVGVELGAGFLSGEPSKGAVLYVEERFDNKFSIGVGYISEQWVTPRTEPKTFVRENLWVQGTRYVTIKGGFELSAGISYWNGTSRALGSNFNAALGIHYQWSNFYVNLRHYSNAGSARPNMGQDMLSVGWRFR
jgi:hypothetical protein